MGKFVWLLLCLALVHASAALKCYNCASNANNKECEEGGSKLPTVECGKVVGNIKTACLKQVLKDKTEGLTNVTRKCITVQNNNADHDCKINTGRYEVMSCDVCYEELCNAAPDSGLSVFLTFSVPLCYLMKILL